MTSPKAMALADKYMSMKGLYSYMKAHYQLIVVTCLSIAIKVDSRTIAVTSQELSELCRGEYTREEIESEEMCVLHALAWYVNPPTASQIANHILALVENFKCAQSELDWAVLVDRVHLLIKASVLDLGLSTQMRPSTLALASILASTESLRDPQCRKAVLRSILSVTNRFDFTSPSEIDIVRTDLTFLQRSYSTSPSSLLHQQPQQAPIVQPANVLSASNSVFGSNVPANPSSRVAEDIPSNLHCVNCADANPSSQAPIQRRREGTIDRTKSGAVTSSQPPRQRSRAGTIGPTTYRRADSSSSKSSTTGSSSDTATHFSSAQEGMKTALVAEEKSSKAFARLEQMLRDEADLAKRLKEKQIMLTEIEAKANEKDELRQCQITQASQESDENTVKLVKTEANDKGNAEADSVLTGTLKQRQTTQTTPQKIEVKTPLVRLFLRAVYACT